MLPLIAFENNSLQIEERHLLGMITAIDHSDKNDCFKKLDHYIGTM